MSFAGDILHFKFFNMYLNRKIGSPPLPCKNWLYADKANCPTLNNYSDPPLCVQHHRTPRYVENLTLQKIHIIFNLFYNVLAVVSLINSVGRNSFQIHFLHGIPYSTVTVNCHMNFFLALCLFILFCSSSFYLLIYFLLVSF